jgi:ribbon-helix-helix CopG family protein
MRRTQLYLDEGIWKTLQIEARQAGTSVSELVRKAIQERYGMSPAKRRQAMQAVVGIWKDRKELPSTERYIRQLRKGTRRARHLRGLAS